MSPAIRVLGLMWCTYRQVGDVLGFRQPALRLPGSQQHHLASVLSLTHSPRECAGRGNLHVKLLSAGSVILDRVSVPGHAKSNNHSITNTFQPTSGFPRLLSVMRGPWSWTCLTACEHHLARSLQSGFCEVPALHCSLGSLQVEVRRLGVFLHTERSSRT